jgi:hypothetical protein
MNEWYGLHLPMTTKTNQVIGSSPPGSTISPSEIERYYKGEGKESSSEAEGTSDSDESPSEDGPDEGSLYEYQSSVVETRSRRRKTMPAQEEEPVENEYNFRPRVKKEPRYSVDGDNSGEDDSSEHDSNELNSDGDDSNVEDHPASENGCLNFEKHTVGKTSMAEGASAVEEDNMADRDACKSVGGEDVEGNNTMKTKDSVEKVPTILDENLEAEKENPIQDKPPPTENTALDGNLPFLKTSRPSCNLTPETNHNLNKKSPRDANPTAERGPLADQALLARVRRQCNTCDDENRTADLYSWERELR